MKIIYSFNKQGYEADYWSREIAAASTSDVQFLPFNHDRHLPVREYIRAQLLDELWFAKDQRLLRLYAEFEDLLRVSRADAVLVDNCYPYHPDYLRRLSVHKVMRTSDGPIAAYDRDFAYLHAYDQVLFHSPAYSRDLTMEEKLRYCGATAIDFWPLGVFEANYDPSRTEAELFGGSRDVDVVFVGAMHVNKMGMLARIKKALGSRIRMFGLTTFKRNLYFNARYGLPGWIRTLPFAGYVPLYQRAKIGINLHNRGKYSVGNYRLYDLPANGVMQISDGGEYLRYFLEPGEEVVPYDDVDDLLAKIDYYLTHDRERIAIARAGYQRVMRDYRIAHILGRGAELIRAGMVRTPRTRQSSVRAT